MYSSYTGWNSLIIKTLVFIVMLGALVLRERYSNVLNLIVEKGCEIVEKGCEIVEKGCEIVGKISIIVMCG